MDENFRFIQVLDTLKDKGLIEDYVGAASVLGTNKAAISDLKSGRKKLSIEILRRMKLSYPIVNIEYIILGSGDMFNESNEATPMLANDNQGVSIKKTQSVPSTDESIIYKMYKEKDLEVKDLMETIGSLKERIKQLERVKDTTAWDAPTSTGANAG